MHESVFAPRLLCVLLGPRLLCNLLSHRLWTARKIHAWISSWSSSPVYSHCHPFSLQPSWSPSMNSQKDSCMNLFLVLVIDGQSMNESTNQSTNQSINQTVNQWINPPINQTILQSINESINQAVTHAINQSSSHSINQTINGVQTVVSKRFWRCSWGSKLGVGDVLDTILGSKIKSWRVLRGQVGVQNRVLKASWHPKPT